MTAIASLFMSERPWWLGVPTTLMRKTLLVPADASIGRLPVYTLTFALPSSEGMTGRAMPHSKVHLELGDVVKMVIPGYKPKSYSISALRDNEFDVTFKVYRNGRASGFLDSLQVGDTIGSFGMSAGRRRNAGSYVGIVAYGVGMTEALPVARAELESSNAPQVELVWALRNYDDKFWKTELDELQAKYPDRFRLVHVVSRESPDSVASGDIGGQRLDANLLSKLFQPVEPQKARFLSVGTKDMMRQTDAWLGQLGYGMPQHALLPKISA